MRRRTRGGAAVWTAAVLGALVLTAVLFRLPGAEDWIKSKLSGLFRPGAQVSAQLGPLQVTIGDLSAGGSADPDALELHVFDVGQADALLVRQGSHAMLVDAGDPGDAGELLEYLDSQGIRRLDWLVLTHPHADHIGGAEAVVRGVRVERVLLSPAPQTTQMYEILLDAVEERGIPVQTARPGDSFPLGKAECLILSPDPEKGYEDLNDWSVTLRVSCGGMAMLLTGDMGEAAEADLLAAGLPVDACVLKAGHHGSASASSQAFLEAVAPAAVIVTCAADSEDNLPNARVLERYRALGAAVFRTDERGAVGVVLRDGRISVATAR